MPAPENILERAGMFFSTLNHRVDAMMNEIIPFPMLWNRFSEFNRFAHFEVCRGR